MLHFNVGSGETRVSFFTMMAFSPTLVMVPILVTTGLSNLHLVLHYNLGSG